MTESPNKNVSLQEEGLVVVFTHQEKSVGMEGVRRRAADTGLWMDGKLGDWALDSYGKWCALNFARVVANKEIARCFFADFASEGTPLVEVEGAPIAELRTLVREAEGEYVDFVRTAGPARARTCYTYIEAGLNRSRSRSLALLRLLTRRPRNFALRVMNDCMMGPHRDHGPPRSARGRAGR